MHSKQTETWLVGMFHGLAGYSRYLLKILSKKQFGFFLLAFVLSISVSSMSVVAVLSTFTLINLSLQESLRRVLQEKLDAVTKLSDLEVKSLFFCLTVFLQHVLLVTNVQESTIFS